MSVHNDDEVTLPHQPAPVGNPPPALPPAPQSRSRGLFVAGVTVVVLALLGGGFLAGWTVRGSGGEDVTVRVDSAPADGQHLTDAVPDVRGLSTVDAQQALADAGLDPSMVSVRETPYAAGAGTVVRQDPIGGTDVAKARALTIYVAAPGTIPDFRTKSATDAATELADLGVRVLQKQAWDPAATEGVVLSTEPAAGHALPDTVTLVVAAPPSAVFLTELEPTESGCSDGEVGVNGTSYEHGMTCDLGADPDTVVYLLGRHASRLVGTVGIADTSDAGAAGRLVIRADGNVVFDQTLSYGSAAPLEVSVAGVLRLELEFVRTDQTGESCCDGTARLGLGDVKAVGGPDEIQILAGA